MNCKHASHSIGVFAWKMFTFNFLKYASVEKKLINHFAVVLFSVFCSSQRKMEMENGAEGGGRKINKSAMAVGRGRLGDVNITVFHAMFIFHCNAYMQANVCEIDAKTVCSQSIKKENPKIEKSFGIFWRNQRSLSKY